MALESSLVGGVRVLLQGRMGGRHGVGSVQKLGLEGRKKSGEVLFSVFSSSLSFPPVFCMAYRSWLPDQRLNLCPPHWDNRVLTTGPPGNPLVSSLQMGNKSSELDGDMLVFTETLVQFKP